MAEATEPTEAVEPFIERYAAIEQAYRDRAWPTVLEEGTALLHDLGGGQDRVTEGLRQRLLLLLGHTHLHGFGDLNAARDSYSAVLAADAEASLRQIAEDGLRQCDLPEEPEAPVASVAPDQAPAAMPWLKSTGVAALVPDVVDEPELIELHQSVPALAEELDLQVRPSSGAPAGDPPPWAPSPATVASPRSPAGEAEIEKEDGDLLRGLLRVVLT
jgi:hypothetical protein